MEAPLRPEQRLRLDGDRRHGRFRWRACDVRRKRRAIATSTRDRRNGSNDDLYVVRTLTRLARESRLHLRRQAAALAIARRGVARADAGSGCFCDSARQAEVAGSASWADACASASAAASMVGAVANESVAAEVGFLAGSLSRGLRAGSVFAEGRWRWTQTSSSSRYLSAKRPRFRS